MNKLKRICRYLFTLALILTMVTGCSSVGHNSSDGGSKGKQNKVETSATKENKDSTLDENASYTSKTDVANYIRQYKKLPKNYITKKEAKNLGWNSSKGNLDEVAPGKSIGGDRFGNFEKKLPNKKNRVYYECDIDYKSGRRNAKRIIYSNDGDIYYTEDHYKTFDKIYGGSTN